MNQVTLVQYQKVLKIVEGEIMEKYPIKCTFLLISNIPVL